MLLNGVLDGLSVTYFSPLYPVLIIKPSSFSSASLRLLWFRSRQTTANKTARTTAPPIPPTTPPIIDLVLSDIPLLEEPSEPARAVADAGMVLLSVTTLEMTLPFWVMIVVYVVRDVVIVGAVVIVETPGAVVVGGVDVTGAVLDVGEEVEIGGVLVEVLIGPGAVVDVVVIGGVDVEGAVVSGTEVEMGGSRLPSIEVTGRIAESLGVVLPIRGSSKDPTSCALARPLRAIVRNNDGEMCVVNCMMVQVVFGSYGCRCPRPCVVDLNCGPKCPLSVSAFPWCEDYRVPSKESE